jgi:hypothetical protein
MTDEERKCRRKITLAKYSASPKGRATQKRSNHTMSAVIRRKAYRASDKGRASIRKHNATSGMRKSKARYKQSHKGLAAESRFCATDKSRAIKRRYNQTPRGRFRAYKVSASARGYVFDLTFEQFMTFWQKPCHYSGHAILTIGLDRVDNTKGYTITNVVPCCTTCNKAKQAMGPDEYVAHCLSVVQHSPHHGAANSISPSSDPARPPSQGSAEHLPGSCSGT